MKAAFIGLGAMGAPMARNLAARGHLSAVWNRSRDKATRLAAELGVAGAGSPAALWQHASVVLLCVRADVDLLEIVEALAVPEARGRLVVDCSTVSDVTARQARDRLGALGARFLDAPITGGTEGARQGSLTFMVGGLASDLAEAEPLFAAMGKRWVHLGPVGAGQQCKAVNQVMAAGINQAVCEGMALAVACGLDVDQVVDVVGSGAAASWFVNHRGRSMVAGDYPPGFRMDLHLKDLVSCQHMAQDHGVALPAADRVAADYERLVAAGWGAEDISALYRAQSFSGGAKRRSEEDGDLAGNGQAAARPESNAAVGHTGEEYWFEEGCWIRERYNREEDTAVSLAEARLPAGGQTSLHRLRGTLERYLVLEGQGIATINGADYPLSTGDSLCIPAGATQTLRNTGPGDLRFLALCTPRFRASIYRGSAAQPPPATG